MARSQKPPARPARRDARAAARPPAGAKPPRPASPVATRPAAPAAEASELRLLYQVAGTIARSLRLDELLGDVLLVLEEQLRIPLSAIYLQSERGGVPAFSLAAQRGFSADFEVERLEFEPNREWMVQSVLAGKPYIAREPLGVPPHAVAERGKREGIQSWMAMPLLSRGRGVGLLLAACRELDRFDPREVRLIETLGPDLGAAIENAQLFELVQRGRNEWLMTFDAVEDRIAVLDRDRRVIRANRSLLSALGRPPATIIGQRCVDLFPALCAAACPHTEALEGRRVEREAADGGRILRVQVYPGEAGQIVHIAEDVTEAHRRAEQLLRAEKLSAASTVLAGIAHELNNPLTVVIAYADLLSQLEATAGFHEEVQQILRSALRCQSIVRSLLAFSRTDAPEESEVDLNQLVRETLPLFAYQLRIAGVRIEERLNPTVPPIAGDRARLQQILVNVINNAFQAVSATRRGGWLKVQTRAREGHAEIEVEDDGPGIPADVLGRVFEPFFTTKPAGQGTGLGLTLSLQIARDHGGDIRIASDGRNGTRVTIALPIRAAAARAEVPPAPDRESLSGRRILVVDDEPELRRLVASGLEAYGAETVLAGGGREALAILDRDPRFDVVFTDLRMPDLGGDGLWAALSQRRSPLADRILLTTGDVAAPAADEAIRATGRPCIPKPFTIRELVAILTRLAG